MKNYSSLLIGGKQFSSRLMLGTVKYKSSQDMVESLSKSQTEIITVAIRRIKFSKIRAERFRFSHTSCRIIRSWVYSNKKKIIF